VGAFAWKTNDEVDAICAAVISASWQTLVAITVKGNDGEIVLGNSGP
jgi:hypothetical protein